MQIPLTALKQTLSFHPISLPALHPSTALSVESLAVSKAGKELAIELPQKVLTSDSLTANNSPPGMWNVTNIKSEQIIALDPICHLSQRQHLAALEPLPGEQRVSYQNNPDLVKRGAEDCRNKVTIRSYRKQRSKKNRLMHLGALSQLLCRIFMNQPVEVEDLCLRPLELHILAEILIRKNRVLSIGRLIKQTGKVR